MKVYEIITDRIMEQLEKGDVPWHKPWIGGYPKNLVSKKEYRGINVFILASTHYASEYWVSYKQAQELGGNVKKGEKGWPVIFWKWLKVKENDTEIEKQVPMLRYYTVFNVMQCEGLKLPTKEIKENNPIEECQKIISEFTDCPTVHDENRAVYYKETDTIGMPLLNLFDGSEEYYSTLFHEVTHSTGHPKRLDREGIRDMVSFGSTNYSKEELVAEMGAAFLCGLTGIENKTIDNSAAYVKSWLKKLHDDKKFVIIAAAQAQKAVDYILNRKYGS